MNAIVDLDIPAATDGEIAAINLASACRRAWARFAQDPRRSGVAEEILDKEQLSAQFLGDLDAFDRMDALARQFARVENSPRAALVQARVAGAVHRFGDAARHLARAAKLGAPREAIERQRLTIAQARGESLETVLDARRRIAAASGRLEDQVPLGAVLVDLGRFAEADAVYRQAFHAYRDISPFAPAWVSFQLGMLWGELVPEPDPDLAAFWYRRALGYLPTYVKARVHLAEIYASREQVGAALALLQPALSSSDPEVRWRLADMLLAQGRLDESRAQLDAARQGFDALLKKHLLAFADHAAEFYADSGNDLKRALRLACVNVANRPTRRSIRLAHAIAAQQASRGTESESTAVVFPGATR